MSEVPTIYLARHGETDWSKSGRHTGRTDIALTSKGEQDAFKIGRRLVGINFSHVLTSPLVRARRTCELAGFAGVVDPGLMEWDYGEYEGLKSSEIRDKRPGWELFRDGCPGGESVIDITNRVDGVVHRLKALTGHVLVFAHGHLLRVLASRWVNQPVSFGRSLLLATATVCILGFDHHSPDEPAISLWNDDRHLT